MLGPLPKLLSTILISLVAAAPLAAQVDPPVDGSFVELLDQPITMSDGYVTLADFRYPDVQPGPQGWPVVVFVHPSGNSRATVEYRATVFAKRGYATITYDVRGQGPAMALNNPSIYGRGPLGIRERLDLAEVIESLEAQHASLLDMDRIGVTGKSQGAVHSWFAAAHSGKTLPSNPWRSAPYPEIKAVVPINFVPDTLEAILPGGETMSELFARDLYDPATGIHHEPSFYSVIDGLVRAENFDAIVATYSDPALHMPTLLENSTTAVFASLVYDDKYMASNSLIDDWEDILPQAPKALSLATTGHNTPYNRIENLRVESRRQDWFDHHLKGVDNGADEWEPIRLAIQPSDATEYADEDSLWDYREFDQFPIPGTSNETWYLRGSSLSTSPTSRFRTRDLEHDVAFGSSIDDYLTFLPTPEGLQDDMPLDSQSWQSFTLSGDRLMIGEPVAHIYVDSNDDEFQIQVSLFEGNSNRYVTSGFTTVRQQGGFEGVLRIPLAFTSYVWEEGSRIQVRVENLGWHRPPNPNSPTVFRGLPIFDDFDVTIESGSSSPSRVDLPLVPFGPPTLLPSVFALLPFSPADFYIDVRADESRAGWDYEILASASGTSPGYYESGEYVPLKRDWLTDRVEFNAGSLPISDFTGQLDSDGRGRAFLNLSALGNIPQRVPQLDFVVLLRGPGGQLEVGGPMRMNVIR